MNENETQHAIFVVPLSNFFLGKLETLFKGSPSRFFLLCDLFFGKNGFFFQRIPHYFMKLRKIWQNILPHLTHTP